MAQLQIGTVTALLSPDDATLQPDDRQELVKTTSYSAGAFVPSAVVVDGGYLATGAIMRLSGVKFKTADWATVEGYWTSRTLVPVVDLTGNTTANCRVRVTQWIVHKKFPSVITADLEIWQV